MFESPAPSLTLSFQLFQFTGWYDCPLSPKGHEEVVEAGQLIKKEGLTADVAYTSLLQRAIRTLWHVLEQTGLMWIPVHKKWELNERHYGACKCAQLDCLVVENVDASPLCFGSPNDDLCPSQCKDWTSRRLLTSTERIKC